MATGKPRRMACFMEGSVQYYYEPWLLHLIRRDSAFLRSVGIKPCQLHDPCPERPPERFIRFCEMTHVRARDLRVRLTEKDAQWLKVCGVAWEPEPAIQLPLDFSGRPRPCTPSVSQGTLEQAGLLEEGEPGEGDGLDPKK